MQLTLEHVVLTSGMWLLSTTQVELRFFNGPHELEEGYAILSHVWSSSEQSFQEIQQLASVGVTYDDPRISEKIRGCVRTAKALGYAWVWVDTCCIDKTSSAELEEAINSMFRWYAEANVCLAYLADTPNECLHPEASRSSFRLSKWFTRGWTLQELIAPRDLVFMSASWTPLGAKSSLADVLGEITGIDEAVLTFGLHISEVPVSHRMSWASARETSRPEDEAYSLMGLFEITMPTIYGEGRIAFRRLQEEIMRRSPDCTLFVWGNLLPTYDDSPSGEDGGTNGGHTAGSGWDPDVPMSASALQNPVTLQPLRSRRRHFTSALLAESPSVFRDAPRVTNVPLSRFEITLRDNRICVTDDEMKSIATRENIITGYGIRTRLVVVKGTPFYLALLPCMTDAGNFIGIPIWRPEERGEDSPGFYTGLSLVKSTPVPSRTRLPSITHVRLVEISPRGIRALEALDWEPRRIHPQERLLMGNVETLHIRHIVDSTPLKPWELTLETCETGPQEVVIPMWILGYLSRHGFEWAAPHTKPSLVLGSVIYPPRDIRFFRRIGNLMLTITIGSCRARVFCSTVEFNWSYVKPEAALPSLRTDGVAGLPLLDILEVHSGNVPLGSDSSTLKGPIKRPIEYIHTRNPTNHLLLADSIELPTSISRPRSKSV
ncbi:heterokaryon incompatibility protein-domain-containing protein [Cubamyces menziesii]|nr:heterokaryon incompatibility protein-domain-containing protein [Cubamyces menziesii]